MNRTELIPPTSGDLSNSSRLLDSCQGFRLETLYLQFCAVLYLGYTPLPFFKLRLLGFSLWLVSYSFIHSLIHLFIGQHQGLPRQVLMVKTHLPMQETEEMQIPSLGWEDLLEKEMQPTPIFLPGECYRQRSLAGYSP